MDYFQGVVTEFLRADRAVFVNPECCIQLDAGSLEKGRHWFCDVMAVNLREKQVLLCEVTYSKTLHALLSRLRAWDQNWSALRQSICRDAGVPSDWAVQPWVFIPQSCMKAYKGKLPLFIAPRNAPDQMPMPYVTLLEKVTPWSYPSERKDNCIES